MQFLSTEIGVDLPICRFCDINKKKEKGEITSTSKVLSLYRTEYNLQFLLTETAAEHGFQLIIFDFVCPPTLLYPNESIQNITKY